MKELIPYIIAAVLGVALTPVCLYMAVIRLRQKEIFTFSTWFTSWVFEIILVAFSLAKIWWR